MPNPIFVALIITACLLFIFLFWAALVSFHEKEQRAFTRFLLLSIVLPIPFLYLALFKSDFQLPAAIILLIITYGSLLVLLIPFGRMKQQPVSIPSQQIDERDTMFSRNELIPGTDEYLQLLQSQTRTQRNR